MRQVLSNDFKRQWEDCGHEAIAAITAVGESGWYILGEEVKAFEKSLAKVFQTSYAVGCANGMDGLEIALRILDLAPNTKVLTTPLSAFATTLATTRAGLKPVFVDVDAHGLMDLDLCEEALTRDPSIRCILPVHLYGHCLDLNRLAAIKKKFSVYVIEDCAQSIMASFEGRPCGSVGELSATSFYPTKNLGAMGDGGAVLTNDPTLDEKARTMRDYGQKAKYVHEVLGLNSRLDELHAAVLNKVFLPRLEKWTARRAEIAAIYQAELSHESVRVVPVPKGSHSCWHLFPVLTKTGTRADFQKYLRDAGIMTTVHYPCLIPDQNALANRATHEVFSDLGNARTIAENVVSLPNHPYMTDDEVRYCVATINRWTHS